MLSICLIISALASADASARTKSVPGRFSQTQKRFILEGGAGWQNIFDVTSNARALPISGDWTGSGQDSVGWFDPVPSTFHLKNDTVAGPADKVVQYGPGNANWLPVVGDWDGNGTTTIGLYDPASSRFFLRNSNTSGPAEIPNQNGFQFGGPNSGVMPIAGDWDGNGTVTVGLYHPASGTFFLKNTNSAGPADQTFVFGPVAAGNIPVVGDWDGNGTDDVGLLYPYHYDVNPPPTPSNCYYPFLERNHNGTIKVQSYANRGMGWMPLAGRWKPHDPAPGNTTPPVPAWCDCPIIYQLRVDYFTAGGKFSDVTGRLDYLSDLGINIILLTPITKCFRASGVTDNFYNVLEPDQIDSALGTDAELKAFIQAAHALGIRVLFDMVPHGVNPHSSIVSAHPDWFVKDGAGHYVVEWGAGQAHGNLVEFDHTIPAVQDWWLNNCLSFVTRFDVDGFRGDLEPSITGYYFWSKVITGAKARGKELFIISEDVTANVSDQIQLRRNFAYHLSQEDSGVNSLKGGPNFPGGQGRSLPQFLACPETFLSACLSSHDHQRYGYTESAIAAYGCLLTPPKIVPFIYMGDEARLPSTAPLYFNRPDWTKANAAALADFKQLVRFRKEWKQRNLGLVPL